MLQMGKGSFREIMGILWQQTKAQSMQLIMAPKSMIAVVMVFRVVRETMMETGMYREFFLEFMDFWTMEGVTGGNGKNCEDKGSGGMDVLDESFEGESGMGSTGRVMK